MKRLVFNHLMGLSLLLLPSGCIYIPVPLAPMRAGEPVMPSLLGDRDSGRQLHIGVSKANLFKVLGTPLRETSDGKYLAYSFAYLRGYWVGLMIRIVDSKNPPPPFDQPRYRCYMAVLKFDGQDKLQSYMIRYDDQTGGMTDPIAFNEMLDAYERSEPRWNPWKDDVNK